MIKRNLLHRSFGRLTVVSDAGVTRHQKRLWRCLCECGSGDVLVTTGGLTSGTTQSCGCLQRDRTSAANRTHGASETRTYSSWKAMMARCYNAGTSGFRRYGGRGIVVCNRWHRFDVFLADMGQRPSGCSLDRIDGAGSYEPSNCRWATSREQALNRRNSVSFITADEEVVSLAAVADYLAINRGSLWRLFSRVGVL